MPMPVRIEETPIAGVWIVHTGIFHDPRGFFAESYSQRMWAEAGFHQTFVQDNLSLSNRGTLRGLHYQLSAAPMGKLVRCLQGAIFDVAVDLRRGSPTFGQHVACELSEENNRSFWVPAGFAHGFLARSEQALVLYKCTSHHAPEHERALHYGDPALGIRWPESPTTVSDKDQAAPRLADAEYDFEYAPGA